MPLDNLHRKLFQENGVSPTLREDIIPWSESPYGSVPIVSKHFTTASAISSGEAVSTHGCGYKFGENALMVFMDGLCLDEGVHYAEAESGEEITLLFDCQAGVTFEFVAHDGYEYKEPPVITGYDFPDGDEDEEWSGWISYESAEEVSVAIEGLPDGASYAASDGQVVIMYDEAPYGTYAFTVTISNSAGSDSVEASVLFISKATRLRYTVAPESTSYLSYCPLDPSRLSSGTSISIDWGDGSSETLTAGTSTTCPVHSYATSDGTRYQITLEADEDVWAGVNSMYFGDTSRAYSMTSADEPTTLGTKSTPTDNTSNRVRYLVSVDTALPVLGYVSREYLFEGNQLLESVPDNLFFRQASEITSFYGCFNYCYSMRLPSAKLFEGCSAATNFGYCFGRCENFDEAGEFPEGFFADCVSMTNANHCFQYAWLGNITSPMFDGLPNLASAEACFRNSVIGDVKAPLFRDLPALTSVSGSDGSCFYNADMGDVSSPLFSDLPILENVSYSAYCCFYQCKIGDVSSPLFESMPSLTNVSVDQGCFRAATFGKVTAPILKDLPALESVAGNSGSYRGCFNYATFESIESPLFSNLPALTDVGTSTIGCFSFITVGTGVIETNLFEDCPLLSVMERIFYTNSSYATLTHVSENLFANLPALSDASYAFDGHSTLSATIDLTGSDGIAQATYFGRNTAGITVKVNAGTTTDSIMSASNAYCTVTY